MSKKVALVASGATLALLLSACSSGTSSLEDVDYNLNGATAEPSVSFETPFSAGEIETHVIEEGTGETIKDGDELIIDATIFSGADGSSQGSTYPSSSMVVPVSDNLKQNSPELYDMLTGHKVGTSFSYTTNLVQNDATSSPSPASDDTPTNVEVYTIQEKLPKTASGTETPTDEINPALKSFTVSDDDGSATLTLSDDRGDQPTELVSQNLITGDGKTVGENDTVYARYVGVKWSDGKEFENNFGDAYNTEPLKLSNVISGWKEGLAGKTVGSRVLLIIPADKAYGEETDGDAPTGALVFVVDILGATDGGASESPSATATADATASDQASGSAGASATASATESASE